MSTMSSFIILVPSQARTASKQEGNINLSFGNLGCSHGIDFCHPVSFQLYQIYAKKPASEVHEILVRYNTSYIILEDSICLAPISRCNLGSNMDLANGHVSSFVLYKVALSIAHLHRFYEMFSRLLLRNSSLG